MHKRSLALIVGLGLAAAACKDSNSVTDLNNVSAEALAAGLTPSSTQLLVTGLLNASRGELDSRYLVFAETMARDFYRLDNAENRYVVELIGASPADYSAFTGGGAFTNMYVTIRSAHTILNALPNAQGLSAAEVKATSGLAKFYKALSLYRVLETRDSLGIAIDVNKPIDDAPAAFVCKQNALAYISSVLDESIADLQAGGASFPFTLPPGFSSNGTFNTPATFVKVAYGLKGKVELYRGGLRTFTGATHAGATGATGWNAAVAAINASFASRTASPNIGIYNTYSTATNETSNPLADANIYLNPFVGDSILAADLRKAKILSVASKTLNGVTSAYKSTVTAPTNLTGPIAVLKNAELLLLRAQAYIELGNFVEATADINAVRTQDGGLPPIPLITSRLEGIKAVLYEKRYSLLGESAHRLVDLRGYGFLSTANVTRNAAGVQVFQNGAVSGGPGNSGDILQTTLPIPKAQLDTRGVIAPATITPTCS